MHEEHDVERHLRTRMYMLHETNELSVACENNGYIGGRKMVSDTQERRLEVI